MTYLLDTNALLFWLSGSQRLHGEVLDELRTSRNRVFVSAVTGLEIAVKASIGRLTLPESPSRLLPAFYSAARLALLDVSMAHALAVFDLPPIHRDPFDRLLVAQARSERMTLVTSDRRLKQYDVDVLMTD